MSELAPWDDLRVGTACPLCAPRRDISEYMYRVRQMSVSSLYLTREQTYRGACVLIYDTEHAVRIDQLPKQQWSSLASDIQEAETAVFTALAPDHINVESLGNSIPHLHWHILPRYKNDGRWGGPVWLTTREEMPSRQLEDSEYQLLADSINAAIDNAE